VHDRTVLVVEDFDDTRGFIRMLLEMKGCRVPVVAMSAHCEGDWRDEALAAGAVDCFSKPIEFSLLDDILGRYAA
jgi:FixJ family two-component response regulator